MAVTLGNNISSLRAQRALGDATSKLGATFERLSSGQRINRASDDAASLAIADALKVGSRLYTQAIRNINDGVSALQIADSALGSGGGILERLSELAEQSANGTLSNSQRGSLDKEFSALRNELYRIIESTEFNGVKLLQQELGLDFQVGIRGSSTSQISSSAINLATGNWVFDLSRVGSGIDIDGDGVFPEDGDNPNNPLQGLADFPTDRDGINSAFNGNLVEITVKDDRGKDRRVLLGLWAPTAGSYTFMTFVESNAGTGVFYATNDVGDSYESIAAGGSSTLNSFTIDPATGRPTTGSLSLNLGLSTLLNAAPGVGGFGLNTDLLTNRSLTIDLSNLSLVAGQQRTSNAGSFSIVGIGSQFSARNALDIVQQKLNDFLALRGKLGADQSRLAASLSVASVATLAFSEAESRIRDVDVAAEAAQLVRLRTLQQTGAQILAQANQQPNLTLALLR